MSDEYLRPTEDDKPAFDPEKHAPDEYELNPVEMPLRNRWKLAVTLGAFGVASILYKVLMRAGQLQRFHAQQPGAHGMFGSIDFGPDHSSLMFMGVPVILCVLLALAPPARTTTGGIMKGITLALLIIAPLVGEGYVCILIAAPLFYAVGLLVATIMHVVRKSRGTRVGCAALIMLPFCLEGTVPQMTFPRAETVDATRVVDAPVDEVETLLARPLDVRTKLPSLLRIGFPRPVASWGSGLRVGDVRGVHFTGAETAPPGDLRLRVAESRPGFVRFDAVGDSSKLTEWMRWRSSEVTWRAIDGQHTQVTWRVQFDRGLDPAWYFGPWERVAVEEAADFLIRANATPVGTR